MTDQPTDSPGKVQEMLNASKNRKVIIHLSSSSKRSFFYHDQEWFNRKTKNGSIERLIVQKRNSGTDDESVELFTSWQGGAKKHIQSMSPTLSSSLQQQYLALDALGVFIRNQLKVLQQSFPESGANSGELCGYMCRV